MIYFFFLSVGHVKYKSQYKFIFNLLFKCIFNFQVSLSCNQFLIIINNKFLMIIKKYWYYETWIKIFNKYEKIPDFIEFVYLKVNKYILI